jgi:hypothetical protein
VVAVHDEYDHETGTLNLAVENVGQGPAKDISFSFSRPIQASDGVVISELPIFTVGLTSLAPGARLTCYWDDLHDQMQFLRRQGLEGEDFVVYVGYRDLPGTDYSNSWDIQPLVYEGLRQPPHPEEHSQDQAGEGGSVSTEGASTIENSSDGGGAQGSPPEPTGEPATTAAALDHPRDDRPRTIYAGTLSGRRRLFDRSGRTGGGSRGVGGARGTPACLTLPGDRRRRRWDPARAGGHRRRRGPRRPRRRSRRTRPGIVRVVRSSPVCWAAAKRVSRSAGKLTERRAASRRGRVVDALVREPPCRGHRPSRRARGGAGENWPQHCPAGSRAYCAE